MIGCEAVCPLEQTQQDEASVGPIAGDEIIVRGAFDPSHGTASTHNVKHGVLPVKDLMAGECSVWRLRPAEESIDALASRLDATRDATLFALVGARADQIRAISFPSGGRAFCVLDECICDATRTKKHSLHGHISFCRKRVAAGLDATDVDATQAKRDLYLMMKGTMVWKLAA